MFKSTNTKKQGDIGLGSAIAYFTSLGWTVCIPLTDSQDYDLIVDDGASLQRVQVKTTKFRPHGLSYEAALKTSGGNRSGKGKVKKFDPSKIELLFILTEDGTRYLIPSHDLAGNTTVSLGESKDKYKV